MWSGTLARWGEEAEREGHGVVRTSRGYDKSAVANAEKQYTVTLNKHELGELMMAVESKRKNYCDDAVHLGRKIERLEQVYRILKRALEQDPADTGKPN